MSAVDFELVPAIDLRHGEVVRLKQGEDARRTVYETDPRPVFERYAASGARRIHLVDLDAAFGEAPQRELLAELCQMAQGRCVVQTGGGLRDRAALDWAVEAGFRGVVVTSLLVREPEECASFARSVPGALIPALDIRGDVLKMSGWTESAPVDLDDLCARLADLPLGGVLVTDIERDGMLDGPNVELAARIGRACAAPSLVSGGVRELAHLEAAVAEPAVGGAIVGRALLDGALDLAEALGICEARTGAASGEDT